MQVATILISDPYTIKENENYISLKKRTYVQLCTNNYNRNSKANSNSLLSEARQNTIPSQHKLKPKFIFGNEATVLLE